jgi:hypothetical protein
MVHKTTDPVIGQPVSNSDLNQPGFPTRRAIIGGAAISGVVWALSYRPAPDPPWTRLTGKALWSPRDGAALLVHNDRLWLLGGSSDLELDLGDGWSTVDGISWSREIDRAAWTPSAQSMSVTFAGRMWRMGGFEKKGNRFLPISEIWSSLDGRNWTLAIAAPAWRARGGGALVVHNGKLWLLGGTQHQKNEGDQPTFNDVWSTENGVDWTEVTPEAPWKARAFHSAIEHDGRIWIIGGGHWGKSPILYNDVWSSSDGINWEEHASEAAWRGRIWATAASYAGLIWVMGGFIAKPRSGANDIWYSTDGSNWNPYLSTPKWPPRVSLCSIVFNDRLWILAGSNGDYINDVWTLKLGQGEVNRSSSLDRAAKWFYKNFTSHIAIFSSPI